MNNTRGLRAHLADKTATVLEDYIRMDEVYNITEISARLPEILRNTLQAAAWSLGLRITEDEIQKLILRLIKK